MSAKGHNKEDKKESKVVRVIIDLKDAKRSKENPKEWCHCSFCGGLTKKKNAVTVSDAEGHAIQVGYVCKHLVNQYKTYQDYRMDPNWKVALFAARKAAKDEQKAIRETEKAEAAAKQPELLEVVNGN